jgi:hypothetical protein
MEKWEAWNWDSSWKEEEDWSADWYDKRWRAHATEDRQSLALTDEPWWNDPWWNEDGHPSCHTSSTAAMPSQPPATSSTAQQTETPQQETSASTQLKRSRGGRQAQGPRLWCHIFINKRHEEFDLVPRLIGHNGMHTKHIYNVTGAKVRVRGRGSGHKEVGGIQEAPVPLMVAVTSDGTDASKFRDAVWLMTTKLDEVNAAFATFCNAKAINPAIAREQIWKYGEMSKDAELVLVAAGLLGQAIVSNSGEQHAFPPPIPKGGTDRTPALTVTSMNMSRHKKDVYTYTRPTLPAKPGPISPSQKQQLHQSLASQDHQHHLDWEITPSWQQAKDEEWAQYHEWQVMDDEDLQLQNQAQSVPVNLQARDDPDDSGAKDDLTRYIESEVLAYWEDCFQ